MRYYGFANFMLSSIQQGVQNFHVCHELFNKYNTFPCSQHAKDVLYDWSVNHKTAVFLNGGNAAGLRDVYSAIERFGEVLELPFVKFHEDEQSLDNTMTACGIVVPTHIIDLATAMRESTNWWNPELRFNDDEIALASFLNQFQLAR